MKLRPIVLDFETEPIESYPEYPPKPVSFSLTLPSQRKPQFYAWGHKTGGNNTSLPDAKRVLRAAYQQVSENTPLTMFNAKFDLDVAEEWFSLKAPPWHCWQDVMFLVFLDDPHQRELGLKPTAARLLNMPQAERDVVEAWVLEHKQQLEAEFPEITNRYGGIKPSTAGAFIGYAPGTVVGPYADGDVVRTLKLFEKLHPNILERGMGPAYDRERKLMPILLRNEKEGLRVNLAAMAADQAKLEASQAKADAWLRKALAAPTLDLDKDAEVAKALDKADMITEWTLTATGRKSTSKKNLKFSHYRDKKVAAAMSYRQKCATTLETFIRPWQHHGASGRMHTTWNQVRQAKAKGDPAGTRTGRPSSQDPNFLNMPKEVKDSEVTGFVMPTHIAGLAPIPKVRSYILPDEKGHLVGRRDFNQQELRVLAHFEDGTVPGQRGALLQAYLKSPRLDVHQFLMERIIEVMGVPIDRRTTKELNFGYIYGQGLPSLAEKMDRTVDEVKTFRAAQMVVLPGLKKLSDELKRITMGGAPIHTWGGREYYVEQQVWSEKYGRWQDFYYKLINYLVQGSSADITKESIIRYDAARKDGRFMLSVYDENDISCPKATIKREMLVLRECMLSIEIDVPLLSDGEVGVDLGNMASLNPDPKKPEEALALKTLFRTDKPEPAFDLSRWGI